MATRHDAGKDAELHSGDRPDRSGDRNSHPKRGSRSQESDYNFGRMGGDERTARQSDSGETHGERPARSAPDRTGTRKRRSPSRGH